MAQPLQYTVRPSRTEPTAHEELERLLETCHQHGLLRFANDVIGANAQLGEILVQGLQHPAVLNAMQNVSIMAMALSQIPPAQFYKMAFAFKDASLAFNASSQRDHGDQAPGLTGVYRMLHDESLWHALQPLVGALKAFAASIEQPTVAPITAFSGKEQQR